MDNNKALFKGVIKFFSSLEKRQMEVQNASSMMAH